MKRNFAEFVEFAETTSHAPVVEIERVLTGGKLSLIDSEMLRGVSTLVVIGFDSLRTLQNAQRSEIDAIAEFLAHRDHLAFICPHHDVGEVAGLDRDARIRAQLAEFRHHGDVSLPPQQGFGGYARSVLAGLGVPVVNRFGLHPASEADGSPAAIEVETQFDRLGLLKGVHTLNIHAHLPQLERIGGAVERLDVVVRQKIDSNAPPHPFARNRDDFDAMLQSKPELFAGTLVVCDATLWSSTAGGVESLRRFWTNALLRLDTN